MSDYDVIAGGSPRGHWHTASINWLFASDRRVTAPGLAQTRDGAAHKEFEIAHQPRQLISRVQSRSQITCLGIAAMRL